MSKKTGDRFNKGKLRWRNFPPFLMRPLIEVGEFGESKYETYNFLNGLPVLDTLDSMQRHMDAFLDPRVPDTDAESGCNHLAHVAWNALVAIYMIKNRPDLDTERLKYEDIAQEVRELPETTEAQVTEILSNYTKKQAKL